MALDFGQYIVTVRGDKARLVFSREWRSSKKNVISQDGAFAVAARAIRANTPASEVYDLSGNPEKPTIVVPAAFLALPEFSFRTAKSGGEMAQRFAVRKAERRVAKAVSALLKANGVSF